MNVQELAEELDEAKSSWSEGQAVNYLTIKHPELSEETILEALELWEDEYQDE